MSASLVRIALPLSLSVDVHDNRFLCRRVRTFFVQLIGKSVGYITHLIDQYKGGMLAKTIKFMDVTKMGPDFFDCQTPGIIQEPQTVFLKPRTI